MCVWGQVEDGCSEWVSRFTDSICALLGRHKALWLRSMLQAFIVWFHGIVQIRYFVLLGLCSENQLLGEPWLPMRIGCISFTVYSAMSHFRAFCWWFGCLKWSPRVMLKFCPVFLSARRLGVPRTENICNRWVCSGLSPCAVDVRSLDK